MNGRVLKTFTLVAAAVVLYGCAATVNDPAAVAPASQASVRTAPSRIVRDGIAVELSMAPLPQPVSTNGEAVEVTFRITDAENETPVTGLNPIAWVDRVVASAADAAQCQEKIKSFLGGSLQARPELDLNSYLIVTLNREGTVSVIDPILGYAGMKLLALVQLGAEGADWALSRDQQTLFVSTPSTNEVVAIDTASWKVVSRISVGDRPHRVATQLDGAYIWVAFSGIEQRAGGVSVIDAVERKEVARIATAAGDHDIEMTPDSRYAFVSNFADGSLSVIDVRELKEVRKIETAARPVALAYSALSNAAYVAHENGAIVVIDGPRHEIRDTIQTAEGLRDLQFSPDGRWGFVLNPESNRVFVVDSSTNEVVQTITAGNQPDQVAFTDLFAYVRSLASEEVTMIRLSTVGGGQQPDLARFPAGQVAPEYGSGPALPQSIVRTPDPSAVLVSNPADRVIYYYMQGMAAPMGSFQNYRREPMGVLTVNRNLRETEPGVYSTVVKMQSGGRFDVPFLLDSPRVSGCFNYSLQLASDAHAVAQKSTVKVERLFEQVATTGEPARIRVRVTDDAGKPVSELSDLRVLTFTPAMFQKREVARPVGEGVYEAVIALPHPGVYYVFVETPSLNRTYRDLPHWVIQVLPPAVSEMDQAGGVQ